MSQFPFVIINESKDSTLSPQVTHDWLARVATAIMVQLDKDFAPHWGGEYLVRVGQGSGDVLPNEIVFAIVDVLPEAPGAIAYHDVNGRDVPVAYLALSTCNTLDDVSIAISHECCETGGDPGCNLWADDGAGKEWALEACDAVESNSYDIYGIRVSDFLYPSFFSKNGQAPYSYTEAAKAPFQTASGGYQLERTASDSIAQVNGKIVLAHKAVKAKHWSSRVYRRGARY